METILLFHDCCNRDEEFDQVYGGPIPHIGDVVSVWSTRDDNGAYVFKQPQKKFAGVVKSVGYVYEELGSSSSNNYKQCYVYIGVEIPGKHADKEVSSEVVSGTS